MSGASLGRSGWFDTALASDQLPSPRVGSATLHTMRLARNARSGPPPNPPLLELGRGNIHQCGDHAGGQDQSKELCDIRDDVP